MGGRGADRAVGGESYIFGLTYGCELRLTTST